MSEELRVESLELRVEKGKKEDSSRYVTVKEYALIKGISRQAVLKAIKAGKLTVRQVPGSGARGTVYEIIADNLTTDRELTTADNLTTDRELTTADNLTTDRELTTADATDNEKVSSKRGTLDKEVALRRAPATGRDLVTQEAALRRAPATGRALATMGTLTANVQQYSEKQQLIAIRRAQVCEEIMRLKKKENSSLSRAIDTYLELYNTGTHLPLVYSTLGKLSASTVRRWVASWQKSKDWKDLVPDWKSGQVGHTVPEEDFWWVIGLLHSDDKPPVSAVIRVWHTKLRMEGREQPVSDRTMERAIAAFARKYPGRWEYMRKGAKYFREHYLPHILVDGTQIEVGEFYLTDGYVCNFMVKNPYTGKECRPYMIAVMDYSSRMIVGFDIDFSENRYVIGSAFRNAFTLWGFVPPYIKMDNGRAFNSQDLVGKKMKRAEREELLQQERDEIAELEGSLYRAGVLEVLNALPYNATGKAPIERFFRTLDTGCERFMPGYVGNGIEDKPASLSRNEKQVAALMDKMRVNEAFTLNEAKIFINWWIMEVYGREGHPYLNGRTPLEVWNEGLKKIPEERKKRTQDLWYLMLKTEIKKLNRNGVNIRGLWYYADELFDYVGRTVKVRYDQMDERYVLVYDEGENFICRALVRSEISPLVTVKGTEGEKMAYTNEMKRIKHLEKKVRKSAEELAEVQMNNDMFMQKQIEIVQNMPSLAQTSSSLPPLPEEEKKEEPAEEEAGEDIIPKEFLDAIGLYR